MWSPLVEYQRNGLTEIVIHGSLSWVEGNKEIHYLGEKGPFYGRSLLKPFQAKAIKKELLKAFSEEERALSLSSHNAEPCHLKVLSKMLSSEDRKFLQTPVSGPLVPGSNELSEETPSQHSCSGKHAAILKVCEMNGWEKETYTAKEHPYHKAYVKELEKHLGEGYAAGHTAPDGCGLSTPSFLLSELAGLYSSLVREKDEDWIWKTASCHPELIGGTGRLDTYILRVCEGRVFAKEGADGLLGLAIDHPSYPKGLGVVIKLAHGWDMKAMSFVASHILRSLGFPVGNPYPLDGQEAVVSFSLTAN